MQTLLFLLSQLWLLRCKVYNRVLEINLKYFVYTSNIVQLQEKTVNSLGHSLINILRKLDLTNNLYLKQVALKNELLCILLPKLIQRVIKRNCCT